MHVLQAPSSYRDHLLRLIKLGVPVVIGQVGVIILGFADTMMVGHFSTDALGAASFVNNIFALMLVAGTGFSYGLTPIVGEYLGQGQPKKIAIALKNALLANTVVAILLSAAMLVLYLFLEQLGQPPELLPLIKPYYLIVVSSLIFIMLFNAFKQFADGIMDTRTSMWILLMGNCLNIVLNGMLIYGMFGCPRWGLFGAGVATLISRIVMLFVFIIVFVLRMRYRQYLEDFIAATFTRESFMHLNRVGWPLALQMGVEAASFCLTTLFVGWLGTPELAAHQIMLTISTLFFFVYFGMGSALAVQVSYYRGKGDMRELKRSTVAGLILICAIGVIFWIPFWPFRMVVCSFFTDNTTVLALLAQLFPIMLLYQFGDCLQITFANALRGIMDVKFLMFASFIAYFIVSLPCSYYFGINQGWGIAGVWLAFPIGLTVAGCCYVLRFIRKTRIAN